MLIAAAPVALPVSTANPPTEAVAAEAAQKTPIPEPTQTTESPKSRHGTESSEQQKNTVEQNNAASQRESIEEKEEQAQDQSEQKRDEQKEQQEQQQLRQEVDQLRQVDREVRAHEAAHASVGGQYAGAPSYTFITGPDGKRYAVAGEVSIDTSRVPNDPEATVQKMLQVQQAALAPADPSSQDLKVAAIANQIANQAKVEANLLRSEEAKAEQAAKTADTDAENEAAAQAESDNSDADLAGRAFPIDALAARRASAFLNQRIASSGAFEDVDKEPLLSQTA